jgi:hypothetical protein
LTSALGGGGWSAPRPGRFTPGKDPVPIVQEAAKHIELPKFKKTKQSDIKLVTYIHIAEFYYYTRPDLHISICHCIFDIDEFRAINICIGVIITTNTNTTIVILLIRNMWPVTDGIRWNPSILLEACSFSRLISYDFNVLLGVVLSR